MPTSTKTAAPKSRQNGSQTSDKTGAAKPKATSVEQQVASHEATVEKLIKQLKTATVKHFGVSLRTREERLSTKVGYAARELLGNDLSAQLKKQGKNLDWSKFNKFFAAVFGEPEELNVSVEVVAEVLAVFFDRLSLNSTSAIEQLVEINRLSLERRNQQQNQQHDDDDFDLDEEEDEEDIIDELDEEDEFEEEDDEEFDEDE